MNNRNVISLDLAKNVIQVCHVSNHAEIKFNKPMSPDAVRKLLRESKPGIVAMEGCGSFHYWDDSPSNAGHEVRSMPPAKVKPYVGKQKTDANDAIGIYIASQQQNMTFCQVKSLEQQNIQTPQTSRRFLEKTLRATNNHIRACLYEYGITLALGKKALREVWL